MSVSNWCFVTCIQVSQEAGKNVVQFSHLLKNFPQFVVIHTVKGFNIVKQRLMFFWHSLAFSVIQQMLTIWSLVPLPFVNLTCTFGSSWFRYSWNRNWIHVFCGSCTEGKFFTAEPPWKPPNVQTTIQLCSFHMLAKLCSKSFMLGFSTTWTEKFQMCKLGFKEAEEPEIKLPTFVVPWKTKGVPENHLLLLHWLH